MQYQVENELEQFDFKDAIIEKWQMQGEAIQIQMSGVVVKAENRANDMLTDRYVDPFVLRLVKAQIQNILIEGYKYYDANDVLLEEIPDQPVAEMEYESLFQKWNTQEAYLFLAERQEGTDDTQVYDLSIDVGETTYLVQVAFAKSVAEWDRFLNRAAR